MRAALERGDAAQVLKLADRAMGKREWRGQGALLLYRGLARELLGDHDAALRDLNQGIKSQALSPEERSQALLQRGLVREELGKSEEAIGDYTAVIALKDYNEAAALTHRAGVYLAQDRREDARQDYLAALSADGGHSQQVYFGLGQVAEAQQDAAAARNFYSQALQFDPGYAAASERLAALSTWPEAAKTADPIHLRPPGSANASAGGEIIHLHLPAHLPEKPKDAALPAVPASSLEGLVPVMALRPALDQPATSAPDGKMDEVQLGAWRSEAEALAGWKLVQVRAGAALDGVEPRIMTAEVPGKGRYFRLRINPGAGRTGAQVCTALAARGLACLPVRE